MGARPLQQALSLWNALDTRRRVIAILAAAAVFAAVLGLARMASQPAMSLLYAGLDPAAAGEVVTALEAQGAAHQVRGNAIYVDSARRDALRMTLAGEGLPANGAQGYELLDTLSGFGTTSQMFDAAYWRAKEGELARTIVSSPQIASARVHLANPSSRPFVRSAEPKASVTVSPRGGGLSSAQARALKFLVASAVAGLDPEDVSVIDTASGHILDGGSGVETPGNTDRAAMLRRNAERLLAARVGPGNAVVEVSVETVTEREQIVERRFDPDTRVAISTETEERSSSSTDSRSGAVTVASNLPDGDAAAGDGASSSTDSETRELVNYEVSETQREILRAPGAIRRLSVAVLINGIETTDGGSQPRSAEELADLRDLVASAVGYVEARGDVITIRSMAFEPVLIEGGVSGAGLIGGLGLNIMSLIQMAVLALVALALGLFVLRPVLTSAPASVGAAPGLPPPFPDLPPPPDLPSLGGDTGGDDGFLPGFATVTEFPEDSVGLPALPGAESPANRLRQLIEDRQEESVEILRGWMEDGPETAQ